MDADAALRRIRGTFAFAAAPRPRPRGEHRVLPRRAREFRNAIASLRRVAAANARGSPPRADARLFANAFEFATFARAEPGDRAEVLPGRRRVRAVTQAGYAFRTVSAALNVVVGRFELTALAAETERLGARGGFSRAGDADGVFRERSETRGPEGYPKNPTSDDDKNDTSDDVVVHVANVSAAVPRGRDDVVPRPPFSPRADALPPPPHAAARLLWSDLSLTAKKGDAVLAPAPAGAGRSRRCCASSPGCGTHSRLTRRTRLTSAFAARTPRRLAVRRRAAESAFLARARRPKKTPREKSFVVALASRSLTIVPAPGDVHAERRRDSAPPRRRTRGARSRRLLSDARLSSLSRLAAALRMRPATTDDDDDDDVRDALRAAGSRGFATRRSLKVGKRVSPPLLKILEAKKSAFARWTSARDWSAELSPGRAPTRRVRAAGASKARRSRFWRGHLFPGRAARRGSVRARARARGVRRERWPQVTSLDGSKHGGSTSCRAETRPAEKRTRRVRRRRVPGRSSTTRRRRDALFRCSRRSSPDT